LLNNQIVFVMNREEAIALGNLLIRRGVFVGVKRDELKDHSRAFYRFKWPRLPAVAADKQGKETKDIALNGAKIWRGETRHPQVLTQFLFDTLTKIVSHFTISQKEKLGDHVVIDFESLVASSYFMHFILNTSELQRARLSLLNEKEREIFFVNVYNLLIIHAHCLLGGPPATLLDRKIVTDHCFYTIDGEEYSPNIIETYILRGLAQLGENDPRHKYQLCITDPSLLFALSDGTKSTPKPSVYSPENYDAKLEQNIRAFVDENVQIDEKHGKIYLPHFFKRYSEEFGGTKENILRCVMKHLGSKKRKVVQSMTELGGAWDLAFSLSDWSPSYHGKPGV